MRPRRSRQQPVAGWHRASWSAALLLSALLAAGCSVMETRPLDRALFPEPASRPAQREPARVAVVMAQPAQSYTSPAMAFRAARVELPIGAIVEAAAQLALAEQFESVGPAEGPGSGLRLRLSNVVPEHTGRLVYVVPLPPLGLIDRFDMTSRLRFTVALLAANGSPRWQREYDTGIEMIDFKGNRLFNPEPLQTGMQRKLHEQAAALARLAAADLRAWLALEQQRERVL